MDDAVSGIPGIRPIHDDVLIYGCGETDEEAERDHDVKFRALMQRYMERNIKLNQSKMKLKLTSVIYLGYVISKDGLNVDLQKLKAIHEMPTPEDKAGVQRLLGMTNFVQRFAPQLSEITSTLRDLLRAETHFLWDPDTHGQAFDKVKDTLSRAPVVKFFDAKKKLTLQCDASSIGLGACLMQDNYPIAYALRSLTATKQNYAQIEKDTLAAVINYRTYLAISDERYSQIKEATGKDESLQLLKKIILDGWLDSSKEVHSDIQVYFPFREELVVQNGVIYKAERVVVPRSITHSIVQRIHNSHFGFQGCIRSAQDYVYWPNMSKDIESYIGQCAACNTYQDNQKKEPMISHEIPIRPWQTIGCDLFECESKDYLILADYYSDYFEVERLHSKTGSIIRMMKSQFARHGIPDRVISDNGPPFGSRVCRIQ
ncbi:uncharacterized protein LOC133203143 [Saccostrea echinata]|uniref:uncharacterized protein LOC133203143 n=1 Tax=Saccostrea echinata TaxID=191078 RepID=UPI002A829743|nr:uncharacterized protein LOC133203143 [Saccostrea echinata]